MKGLEYANSRFLAASELPAFARAQTRGPPDSAATAMAVKVPGSKYRSPPHPLLPEGARVLGLEQRFSRSWEFVLFAYLCLSDH